MSMVGIRCASLIWEIKAINWRTKSLNGFFIGFPVTFVFMSSRFVVLNAIRRRERGGHPWLYVSVVVRELDEEDERSASLGRDGLSFLGRAGPNGSGLPLSLFLAFSFLSIDLEIQFDLNLNQIFSEKIK